MQWIFHVNEEQAQESDKITNLRLWVMNDRQGRWYGSDERDFNHQEFVLWKKKKIKKRLFL